MGSKKNKRKSQKRRFQGNRYTASVGDEHGIAGDHLDVGQQEGEADLQQDLHQETECQNSRPSQSSQQQEVTSTPSPRKRLRLEMLNEDNPIEDNNFFLFINFSVLTEIVDLIGKCPVCKDNHIAVTSVAKERMGFATKLKLFCPSCSWEKFFFTSEECFFEKKRGRNYYEVNVRAVTAFREMGRGHQAIVNFSIVHMVIFNTSIVA